MSVFWMAMLAYGVVIVGSALMLSGALLLNWGAARWHDWQWQRRVEARRRERR